MAGKTFTTTIPTGGGAGVGDPGPDYSTDLTSFLAEVKTFLETKLRPTEMNIDSELDVNSQDVKKVSLLKFIDQTTVKTGAANIRSLQWVGDDLYGIDGAGRTIQVFSNGSLNIAAVGGIVGDYGQGGVDAQVTYADATGVYDFHKDQSPSILYGKLHVGPVRITEYSAGKVNYVEHKSPAALASSYSVEWPAALPAVYANETIMAIDNAGAITATKDPTVDTLTTDGKITSGGNLDMQGNKEEHTERVIYLGVLSSHQFSTDSWTDLSEDQKFAAVGGSALRWNLPSWFLAGKRIKKIEVRHNGQDATAKSLLWGTQVDSTPTTLDSNVAMTGAVWELDGITGLTEVIAADKTYWIKYISAVIGDTVHYVKVTYDSV